MSGQQQQLATRFSFLRQGWFYIVSVVVLSLIRKWLLSRGIERPPPRGKRRAAPIRRLQNHVPGSCPHAAHGTAKPPESVPVIGASEEEMGPQWHFDGCRRWHWLHDGIKTNGWVEFGAGGILTTSLCRDKRGTWELQGLQGEEEMVLTFGKCLHKVLLLPPSEGSPPMFEVSEREMKDGSAPRIMRRPQSTRGCLVEERCCISFNKIM